MARAAVSLSAYWRLVLDNPNFRRLWLAQIVSELGDWIYSVAIYALLLEVTHSAKSVALAVVLQLLPQTLAAPSAGIVNDRMSRKRVMIAADLARAAVVFAMLFVSRAGWIWAIYVLLFLETVLWGFFEPGRSSVLPNITRPGELVVANALSSVTWSTTLALGAGLGGLFAAFLGRDAVFVLNSLSFLISAALLSGMRFAEPHVDHAKPLRARDLVDFSPVAEGVSYVRANPRLIALLLAKGGLGVMGVHWVLLPIFGERIFPVRTAGVDPQRGAMLGMSILMSARGIGALLGPFIAAHWTGEDHRRLRLGILIGFGIAAIGYASLALAPTLAIATATVIFGHCGSSIVWVFATTLLQSSTDDRFRGRVFSADFACLVVGMAFATSISGTLIDAGVSARAIAAGTAVFALVPVFGWALAQKLWKISAANERE